MGPLALLGELPWKPMAIIGACVVLFLIFGKIQATFEAKGKLTAQLDQSIDIGNGNAAAADHAAELVKKANGIAAAEHERADKEHAKYEHERYLNAHVKAADNGPIAPVLRRELDRLPQPATPDDHQAGAATAARVPSGPVHVPQPAGSPAG